LRGVFSKQNSVIRLKSNLLSPQNFWSGYATDVTFKMRLFVAIQIQMTWITVPSEFNADTWLHH